MNTIVILVLAVSLVAVFFAGTSAAPAEITKIPVTRLIKNNYIYDNNGQFSLNYELDDGTSQTRQGTLALNEKGDDYVLIQKGSYSYVSPEGVQVKMSYTADKDGFKISSQPFPYNANEVPAAALTN